MRGGKGKRILIEAFADLLPPAIQQRGKMGFGVPLDHLVPAASWPAAKEVLLDPEPGGRPVPSAGDEQLVTEHVTSRWDHSYRLWSLLVWSSGKAEILDSHAST